MLIILDKIILYFMGQHESTIQFMENTEENVQNSRFVYGEVRLSELR